MIFRPQGLEAKGLSAGTGRVIRKCVVPHSHQQGREHLPLTLVNFSEVDFAISISPSVH